MNKRGQLDEFNPAYIALAFLGGAIAWFVASRAVDGAILPIIAGVGAIITTYLYLTITDR